MEKAITSRTQEIQSDLEKYTTEKDSVADVSFQLPVLGFSYALTLALCPRNRMFSICHQINRNLIKSQEIWRNKVKEVEERYIYYFLLYSSLFKRIGAWFKYEPDVTVSSYILVLSIQEVFGMVDT